MTNASLPGNRPSLLFLCQTLPFPPDGGVNIRSYNVLRLLARHFDVTALCFFRRAVRPTQAHVAQSVAALSQIARPEAYPIPQEHSRLRLLTDHIWSVSRRASYVLKVYESRRYRERIDAFVRAGTIDLVHMDSLDLAVYLPMLRGLPVVCTHHNVESQLLRRRASAESAPWRRRYLLWQACWYQDLEQRCCGEVALNLTVSEADRQELERIAPGARFGVVPNGVDVETFRPVEGPQEGLVFVGGLSWFPNRDALDYFGTAILPVLRRSGVNPAVRWVGRGTETELQEYRNHFGIELTGYVDDVRPWIARAACYVVPLRVGGGTRLKILDAWAMGKAVVSTTVGCEGLDARDGKNILIRDDPNSFALATQQVLADDALRARLGRAARKTAEERYSWTVIETGLRDLYLPLVGVGNS